MSATELVKIRDPIERKQTWIFRLADVDAVRWDRERLEMALDALWLLSQAIQGRTEGPLTLPLTGLPVRVYPDADETRLS